MLMRIGISTLIVVVARTLAMVVKPSILCRLMASMVLLRAVRMSPGGKQTVGQVQQDCTESDEFEVLA